MEKRKSNTLTYLKRMWNGDYFPALKDKFTILCYVLGAIHAVYALIFFILKAPVFGIYNVFSAYLFICTLTVLLRKESYYTVFLIAEAEITFFSVGSTLLLGWAWGFMFLVLALCPLSFFMTYSLPGVKRSFTRPCIFSMVHMVIYIIARVTTNHMNPLYPSSLNPAWAEVFYIANFVVAFLAIVASSTLFSMEIRCKEKELEKNNKNLEVISTVDPLTGLLNRRAMMEILADQVTVTKATGELFSMAIGDIDNFKMVNDIHGHNVGDDVLVMVSKAIKEALPEGATLCRWGGEEFLILIKTPEVDAVPAIEAVRYAVTQVSTRVEKPDGAFDLSVSMTFGVSQYMHGFSIDKVISLADENLYKGKASGKNKVVHSKSIIEL